MSSYARVVVRRLYTDEVEVFDGHAAAVTAALKLRFSFLLRRLAARADLDEIVEHLKHAQAYSASVERAIQRPREAVRPPIGDSLLNGHERRGHRTGGVLDAR